MPSDLVTRGYDAVASHYRLLSRRYGAPFDVPGPALLALANAALEDGDTAAALNLATLCATRHPGLSRAHYVAGLAEERAGNLEAARAWYRGASFCL